MIAKDFPLYLSLHIYFYAFSRFGKSNKEDKAAANKDQTAEKENSGKQKNDKPLPEILEMDRNWKNPRADPERLEHISLI